MKFIKLAFGEFNKFDVKWSLVYESDYHMIFQMQFLWP